MKPRRKDEIRETVLEAAETLVWVLRALAAMLVAFIALAWGLTGLAPWTVLGY